MAPDVSNTNDTEDWAGYYWDYESNEWAYDAAARDFPDSDPSASSRPDAGIFDSDYWGSTLQDSPETNLRGLAGTSVGPLNMVVGNPPIFSPNIIFGDCITTPFYAKNKSYLK